MNYSIVWAFVSFISCTQAVFDCAKYEEHPYCRCKLDYYDTITCFIDERNEAYAEISYHPEDGTMIVDCGMLTSQKQCSEHVLEIYLNSSNITINYFTILHNAISKDDISYSEFLSKFDTENITVPFEKKDQNHIQTNGLILCGADSVYSYANLGIHEAYSRVEWFKSNTSSIDVIRKSFRTKDSIFLFEFNNYQSIPFDNISELKNLTELYYWDNNNFKLNSADFNALENLITLKFSKNTITNELPHDVFYSLKKLESIIMINNTFKVFPKNLFSKSKSLKNVQLRHNNVRRRCLPNKFLSDLPNLENVDLSYSGLLKLPFDTFHNSTKLWSIDLSNNKLVTLHSAFLKDAVNLIKLDLSYNRVMFLSSMDIFQSLVALQELHLNNNLIEVLESEILMSNKELKSILMSQNRIHTIHSNFRNLKNLERIDLSYNTLDFKRISLSPFYELENLLHLNLSHNNILNYDVFWSKSQALQILDLSFNRIQNVSLADFHYDQFIKSKEIIIDIRQNEVANILDYNHYSFMKPIEKNAERRLVLIGGNPFDCNCLMFDFVQYLQGSKGETSHTKVELAIDDAVCAMPKTVEGKLLSELDDEELTCDLSRKEVECPDRCNCSYQHQAIVIHCEDRKLGNVPQFIGRTLYIDGKQYLETNAYELHLEHNNIADLQQLDGSTTKLFLRGNQVSNLPLGVLPPNITTLDLRDNNLETMSKEMILSLTNNPQLEEFYISGNPFSCSCFDSEIITILQTNQPKISDYDLVSCADGRLIAELTEASLCLTMGIVTGLIVIAIFGVIVFAVAQFLF